MPKLIWDEVGKRFYETGLDHGVLYVYDESKKTYKSGVPWNGLTAVSETPSGGESNPQYADNIKYIELFSEEEFGASIEAFTYPVEFEACDGTRDIIPGVTATQQRRTMFAMSYRTIIGNDTSGNDYGYKLHIVYGAHAKPSERQRNTINDSPELTAFSWELTTSKVPVTTVSGLRATAHVVIDSTKTDTAVMKKIEEALYGSETKTSNLLTPDDIFKLTGV